MLFFHINKQKKMKIWINKRHKIALTLEAGITNYRSLTNNLFLVTKALDSAQGDETGFRELFNEDIPAHMKRALKLEVQYWLRIKDAVELLCKVQISLEDFQIKANALRQSLKAIQRIEELQMEMLYSPLRKHYEEILSEIESKTR